MRTKTTRTLRWMTIGVSCLSCLSVSGVAQAMPLTFQFEGKVEFVGPVLNPPILPNTPLSGTYTFESTTTDLLPGDSSRGRYALSDLSFTLLGNTYSMGTTGQRSIEVLNLTGPNDQYGFVSQSLIGPSINGLIPLNFSLNILGINAFTDDSLPLTPPSLSSLSQGSQVRMVFANPTLTFATPFSGPLTSPLAAVPEPSALVLMGLGLLGLMRISVGRRMAARTSGAPHYS